MKLYHQFINILNKKEKKNVITIIILTIFVGMLEMIGIGMVPTFLYGITEPNKFLEYFPNNIFQNFEYFVIYNTIIFFLLFTLVIFIFKNFLLLICNFIIINLRGNIREGIINRCNKYYNSINYLKFIRYNSSTIIRNVTIESQNTSNALRDISVFFNEIIIIFFILILNFIFNFKITLVTIMVLIVPAFIYFIFTRKFLKKIGAQNVEIRSLLIKTINQTIGSFKENLIQKNIPFLENYFRRFLSKEINNIKKYNFLSVLPKIFFEIIAITIIIITVYFLKIDKAEIIQELPNFSFFLVSLIKLMPSISRISVFISKILYNSKSVEIVHHLHTKLKDNKINLLNKKTSETKLFKFNNIINFENVSFDYSSDLKFLRNINFEINKKQIVLIKGVSGSGKSTLIDLILGLLKPTQGKIKISGNNIEGVLEEWQKKISLLPQKVFLLEDSIRNNIIFGSSVNSNSEEKIQDIIKKTNLEYLIDKFKDGIDTKLNEMGKNLSGGEIQRIGLARTLYRESEIIICDEPTTGLDDQNVEVILKILNNISTEKMIILVSHEKILEKICDVCIEVKNNTANIIN